MFKTNSNTEASVSSPIIAYTYKMWFFILNQNIFWFFFKKGFQNQFEVRGHLVSIKCFNIKVKKTIYHNIYTYRNNAFKAVP